MDENLFYKGVDKRTVHGARLHQTHSLSEPEYTPPPTDSLPSDIAPGEAEVEDSGHPPYPFESGNSLLALTKKHNVCTQ